MAGTTDDHVPHRAAAAPPPYWHFFKSFFGFPLLFLHEASFVGWAVLMTVHVLALGAGVILVEWSGQLFSSWHK